MRNKTVSKKCQRFLKISWHYKGFHYSNWGYALLIALVFIYIFGGIHYQFVESELKIEEINYTASQKKEIQDTIRLALNSDDYIALKQNWKKYKNKMMIIVQDYYNFKIYYDSHEEYNFITSKKQLEYFLMESRQKKYEVSIYSIYKKRWNSVYKHWLKYFNRSLKPSSKYNYLTLCLISIYPIILFSIIFIKTALRIKKIRGN